MAPMPVPVPLDPRFAVDGMALLCGKYLRCLGYDATWAPELATRELAGRAAREGRVLLTRNTRLGTEIVPAGPCLHLESEDAVEQFREVVEAFGLRPDRAFTRCIRCNVALVEVDRESVRGLVPEGVFARRRRFFRCPSCGTTFWLGNHVADTCAKLGIPVPPDA